MSFPIHNAEADSTPAKAPEVAERSRRLALVRPGMPVAFQPETPWVTPPSYELRNDGVFELKLEKRTNGKGETKLVLTPQLVAHSPVWLTSQVLDIDTGTWAYTVAARSPRGDEVHRTLSAGMIADKSKLVALSDFGFPIHSANGLQMVRYLSAAIAANGAEHLPMTLAASRMIWRKMTPESKRADGFNFGSRLLQAGKPDALVAPAAHSGIDAGHFERFTSKGDATVWAAAVMPWLKEYPIVATMVCAGLASVLCHLLRIPNRIFEMAGNSGVGKTSTAQLVISFWGNPDAKKLLSWNGTSAALERAAALHGNCVLIVDENSQHGRGGKEDKGGFAQALFQLAEGKSRPRSNENLGLRAVDVWRLNIITTGEVSGQSSTAHGGILSRLISFWGSPLGGPSEETGRNIKATMQTALEHHGHAAPLWIKELLELKDEDLTAMREYAVELQAKYATLAGSAAESNLVARWSESYAAMHIVAEWLEDTYPEHLPKNSMTAHLATSWTDACSKVRSIDPSQNALDTLRGWLAANEGRLIGSPRFNANSNEVVGVVRDTYVAIIPETLEKARVIQDLDAILKGWHGSGLLLTDAPNRHKKTVKIGKSPVKCIVFPKSVLWPETPGDDEGSILKELPTQTQELDDMAPVVAHAIPESVQMALDEEDEERWFSQHPARAMQLDR
jgi:hypothetical protein